MVMESNGYKFDSNDYLIGYRDFSISKFSNSNNPHAYSSNVLYFANLEVRQWIDKSVLATARIGNWLTRDFASGQGIAMNDPTVFIKEIPDQLLNQITSIVPNALLVYTGAQTFIMANGSSQVFPVFQIFDLFDYAIAQSTRAFNRAFDERIFREENGIQYSKIGDRIFGRDVATKRELYEWNGEQWIVLLKK